ncbi:MAG: hypothetical protein QOG94_1597, partial [Solirubrobacteraceae bacterium]|nr:hypothetical protein [Solirubrobacteraceae bacterium]
MAVTHRAAITVVTALRPDDLIDLVFHQLGQHTQADTDAQREQSFLRGADELAQRFLHAR